MDDRIAEDARFALLAKVRQARMMSARAKLLALLPDGIEFEEQMGFELVNAPE